MAMKLKRLPLRRWRALLVAMVVSMLALAITVVAPSPASANTCDGTHLRAVITNYNGTAFAGEINSLQYPSPSGEISISRGGNLHYLTLTGVVRPSTEGVFAFVIDPPGNAERFRYRTTSAGSNGVIRHERNIVDVNSFASPGERFRVGTFFYSRYCGGILATLGWINVVP
jgi:hypothetical protein